MSRRKVSVREGAAHPLALAASVVFHAVLLLLLARFLSQTSQPLEAPVLQVTLVAPPRAERAAPRPPSPRRERDRAGPDLAPTAPAEGAATVAPRVAPEGDGGLAGRAQRALRGLGGCDRAGLTREERQACETRRWASLPDAAARPKLDPAGRYIENPEPFLSRRPTKGCRARATGDTNAMGDSGNARAGVTCVIPF